MIQDFLLTSGLYIISMSIVIILFIPLTFLISPIYKIFKGTKHILFFISCIPPIALTPLFILLIGYGLNTKIFIIVFCSLVYLLVGFLEGIRTINKQYIQIRKMLNLSYFTWFFHILFPAILKVMGGTIKNTLLISVMIIIVVEILIGGTGLGGELYMQYMNYNLKGVILHIILIGIFGTMVNIIGDFFMKKIHWTDKD